jgi:hypothetical protein
VKITDSTRIAPLSPVDLESEIKRATTRGSGQAAQPDRVSVSPAARRMQQEEMDRIAALAEQVAGHQYVIDLDKLADAIVRKELL